MSFLQFYPFLLAITVLSRALIAQDTGASKYSDLDAPEHQYWDRPLKIAPASGWLLVAIGVWMCLHLTLRLF